MSGNVNFVPATNVHSSLAWPDVSEAIRDGFRRLREADTSFTHVDRRHDQSVIATMFGC